MSLESRVLLRAICISILVWLSVWRCLQDAQPADMEQPALKLTDPRQPASLNTEASMTLTKSFQRWLSTQGGSVNCIEITRGPPRGVVSKKVHAAGALLLQVPPTMLVTESVALASPLAQELSATALTWTDAHLDWQGLVLVAWLLHERVQQHSLWQVFIDSLPSLDDFADHPMLFPFEEASTCFVGDTKSVASINKRHTEWDREFNVLSRLPSWNGEKQMFKWARLVVLTRAFTLPLTSSLPNGRKDHMVVLVPFADMLNHDRKKNAAWSYSADGFQIHAATDIDLGAEVVHSYGTKSNAALLGEYGFVGSPTLKDAVTIEVGVGEGRYAWKFSLNPLASDNFLDALQHARTQFKRQTPKETEDAALRAMQEACSGSSASQMRELKRSSCISYSALQKNLGAVCAQASDLCLDILASGLLPILPDSTAQQATVALLVWSWVKVATSFLPEGSDHEAQDRLERISGAPFMTELLE